MVISLFGCQAMRWRVPSRPRKARKLSYSLWTMCGPMSTPSPVAPCVQPYTQAFLGERDGARKPG
jgi:hypothetical protein